MFVSADGKDFIPMLVKQTAAERREAKLKQQSASSSLQTRSSHAVLSSISKLSSGCDEIIEG